MTQLADGSLDDAIPTIAVVASLGAVLYSSAGALKGIAAVLFGGAEATASHILVKDKGTAESLLERLRDGPQDNLEDRFAREAGKYSECPSKSKGGSLGTFKPGQMVKEFDTAVFNGPVGAIQGPCRPSSATTSSSSPTAPNRKSERHDRTRRAVEPIAGRCITTSDRTAKCSFVTSRRRGPRRGPSASST